MKKIFSHENRFVVHNVQNLLQAEGIESFLKNEFAQGAVGELSAFDAWPELWVDEAQLAKAESIVDALAKREHSETEWLCPQCSEHNDDAFEVCWNCQQEKP